LPVLRWAAGSGHDLNNILSAILGDGAGQQRSIELLNRRCGCALGTNALAQPLINALTISAIGASIGVDQSVRAPAGSSSGLIKVDETRESSH
jgi:hypothetical protein